jgi:hypothetical protein
MIINRLNDILRKCSNTKFRRGYIKYLRSLDFKEFEKIFIHYSTALQIIIIRYTNSRFLSKNWFKKQILQIKFNTLCQIFFEANYNYLISIKNNIDSINNRREKILTDIKNMQAVLNIILENVDNYNRTIKKILTAQDLIYFNIVIINNIYFTDEIEKLIKELNNLNKLP